MSERTAPKRDAHSLQEKAARLDYDPVAFAVLAIGMGMIALLAMSI
jgi:hypothetical protein